jgi:site-specific DNA-methyltransferase (adenine-specific)
MTPYHERSNIRIYHGDCLDLLPELPTESVDFVLTDPPYLVDYRGRWDRDQKAIVGDDDPAWLKPAFAEIFRAMKNDTFAVSFYGWPHADVFVGTFKQVGFRLVSHMAFIKNVWGLGRFTRGQHETAYLLAKGKPPIPKAGISDVFEWTRERDPVHPNQKPEGALRKILSTYAPKGGLVLDPFAGSCSTLVAAKSLGMAAIGCEIEERFCKLGVSRLAQEVLFV